MDPGQLFLQLASLARYHPGFSRPVDFTRQEHTPRHNEEFAGKRDDRLAEPDLARLAGIKLTEGGGVPSGEGMGSLDEEGAEQRAACFADASLAALIT